MHLYQVQTCKFKVQPKLYRKISGSNKNRVQFALVLHVIESYTNLMFHHLIKKNNFEITSKVITVRSFDSEYYICITRDSKVKKSSASWQAVYNNLYLDEFLKETCLNHLKLFFISKRFSFNNILIMHKGQAPKLYGAVVNILVDPNKTYNLLPSEENIIMINPNKK